MFKIVLKETPTLLDAEVTKPVFTLYFTLFLTREGQRFSVITEENTEEVGNIKIYAILFFRIFYTILCQHLTQEYTKRKEGKKRENKRSGISGLK